MFGPTSLIPADATPPVADPLAPCLPHLGMQTAKILKDKLALRYDEAISFSMPGRDGLNQGPDQAAVYDDTAMLCAPEFASRIQQGVMPNFSRWGSFVAGIMIEDEDDLLAMRAQLEKIDRYLFEMINTSSFSVEANECFLDLGLGTGAMRIDEAAGKNPFGCRSVPLRGLLFCIGPDGLPDPIWETRKMTRASIAVNYPGASMPPMTHIENGTYEFDVVECWQRDWREPAADKFRMSVFMPTLNNAVILQEDHEGEGCCPYIVFRWSKASGEGWGRGPLFNCLPSMRKVNFVERAALDHMDMQIAGIWTIEDDGVVNVDTVRLAPGTMIPKAPGSDGLKNELPASNMDFVQYKLEESRTTIKRALYTEQLGNPNKTPMSATEVSQRMAELARAIGAPFVRIVLEFLMPAIVRFIRILKDRKLITMPQIDGKEIKLISTSPLAQAQRFDDIDAIDKFLGTMGARLGMEMVNVVVDGSAVGTELGTLYGVPAKLIRPPAQQKQIMQAMSQMAAASQGAPGGGQAGDPSAGAAEQPAG